MKTPLLLLALGGLATAPLLSLTSCSSLSGALAAARGVDLSKFPGLDALVESQKDMMGQYAESSRLLLASQEAALTALQKDAEALQASLQAGEQYDKAVKIANRVKKALDEIRNQQTVLTQTPDFEAIHKFIEQSRAIQDLLADNYNEMARIRHAGNAEVAKANKQGDKFVLLAYKHLDEAANKIAESYGLLQDARKAEVQLTVQAAAQSAVLVKSFESASAMDKAALGAQFRPIIFFLTGLPDELDQQEKIAAMWEQHAKDSNIKLPSPKVIKVPDSAKKLGNQLTKLTVGSPF